MRDRAILANFRREISLKSRVVKSKKFTIAKRQRLNLTHKKCVNLSFKIKI